MKSQNKKSKKLIISVLICCILVVAVLGLRAWNAYKQKEKKVLFTQYQLTEEEVNALGKFYGLSLVPTGISDFDIESWPNFQYYKLVPTERTASWIETFNEWTIDKKDNHWRYDIALYYGLNSDNYMTEEWVLSHPKEAAFLYTGGPLEDGRIVYW